MLRSVKPNAKINTESPAWAIDLSILALKIYHMNEEATRVDAAEHRAKCQEKLNVCWTKKTICLLQ
jgi:hypothetical protein